MILLLVVILLQFQFISAAVDVSYNDNSLPQVIIEKIVGAVGSFLGLDDTPASYVGQANLCVKVSGDESKIVFGSCSNITGVGDFSFVNFQGSFNSNISSWWTLQDVTDFNSTHFQDAFDSNFSSLSSFLNSTYSLTGAGGNASWNESFATSLYVPYEGATKNINLSHNNLTAGYGLFIGEIGLDANPNGLFGYPNTRVGTDGHVSGRIGFEYELGGANSLWQIDNGGDHLRFFNDSHVFARINKSGISSTEDVCLNDGSCLSSSSIWGYNQTEGLKTGYWNLSSNYLYTENTNYSIGIGTSTPEANLHVKGDIKFEDNDITVFTEGGTLVVSG